METTTNVVTKFEAFLGRNLKVGRETIAGYPVDIADSDGTYLDFTAVDYAAALGLAKTLRRAGFKVKRDGVRGLTIR